MGSLRSYPYFFYAESLQRAESLRLALLQFDYDVAVERTAVDQELFCVSGKTTPLADDAFERWYDNMCELAFTYTCEFDGLGCVDES